MESVDFSLNTVFDVGECMNTSSQSISKITKHIDHFKVWICWKNLHMADKELQETPPLSSITGLKTQSFMNISSISGSR